MTILGVPFTMKDLSIDLIVILDLQVSHSNGCSVIQPQVLGQSSIYSISMNSYTIYHLTNSKGGN